MDQLTGLELSAIVMFAFAVGGVVGGLFGFKRAKTQAPKTGGQAPWDAPSGPSADQ